MGDWNPTSPTMRGQEWLPTAQRAVLLDDPSKAAVARVKAPGSVTVTQLHAYLSAVSDSSSSLLHCAEVVSPLRPAVLTNTYRPAQDTTTFPAAVAADAGKTQAAGTSNLFQSIDEATLDITDYLTRVEVGKTWAWAGRTTMAAGAFTSQRVLSVRVRAVVQSLIIGNAQGRGSRFALALFDGTSVYPGSNVYLGANQPRQTISYQWDVDPRTGLPWTVAGVENLKNTSGTLAMGVIASATSGFSLGVLYQAWLDVDYCVENRLGFLYGTSRKVGWNELALGSTAAMVADNYYYVVQFCPNANASRYVKVPILRGNTVLPQTSAASTAGEHRQAFEAKARGGGAITSVTTPVDTEILPVLLETGGGIQSQSSPWAELAPSIVNSGRSIGQEITTAAAQAYRAVKVAVGWEGAARPTGPLKIQLVDGGSPGSGTVRATALVTPEMAPSKAVQVVQAAFAASFSASATTQYSLLFTSTAASGSGWIVQAGATRADLLTGTTAAEVDGQTMGGTTDAFFLVGSGRFTAYDLEAELVAGPNAPGSFAATAQAAS